MESRKGAVAVVSKDAAKTVRKGDNVVDSFGRKSLAQDLEPLEEQRQQIEAAIAKLKDLADLKESGVLTEEEFQAEKKRIPEGN